MNLEEIRKIIKIFEKSEIGELEIVEDNYKIRMSKSNNSPQEAQIVNGAGGTYILPAQQVQAPPVETPPVDQPATKETVAEKEASENENYFEVRSPMVGTFYRASSPDSDPYVEIGQTITAGDTLCIIEAMKLMNEIQADVSGKIVKILVENAQPVEYNQVLFLIKKD